MNADILKRIVRAIADGSQGDLDRLARKVVESERDVGHTRLAEELETILNKPKKPYTNGHSTTDAGRPLRELPLSRRHGELLASFLPRESLEHYMVLPGPIEERFTTEGLLPHCEGCGGLVKAATISFGQPLPVAAVQRAEEVTLACDLFLVLGSSLVVYPAAAFPRRAQRNGARLVIINREPTPQDELADLVIHAEIGTTLGEALGVA